MREEGAKGELKHHVTRIAILLAGYCLARFASHGYESSSPMIGFGLAGFVLLMVGIRIYGCFNSSLSEPLNWVNVMLDPLVAAALIISAGDSGVALVFVFSWMPISDGFRRGERWLVVSALFSSIGLLCVLLSASYFDDAGLLLCGIFAGHVLVISYIGEVLRSYRRTQEKLSAMSMRDTLTQLPNRRLFLEHLRHLMLTSRRSKNRIACLFIDLDGFKAVNDRLGHSVGDKVLLRVAEVLKRHLRQGDIAARLASSILREIEAIRRIDDHAITLSASIGIAFYQGDPNERNPDADKLIGEADHYMYDAKRAGKGQIVAPALNVVR
jgi:GGDEF domain-containing protein